MKKSAFPSKYKEGIGVSITDRGISQRLYIATQLFASIISSGNIDGNKSDEQYIKTCFNGADELIKQDDDSN